jgi:hypothetical protein
VNQDRDVGAREEADDFCARATIHLGWCAIFLSMKDPNPRFYQSTRRSGVHCLLRMDNGERLPFTTQAMLSIGLT